jgi:hypothetical protein
MEKLKFLGRTIVKEKCTQEKVKSRLTSGNACHSSVQNFLSYRLL